MNFFARKLNPRTFDVFEGNQYHPDFWSRLKAGRNGVYVQKGRSLPHRTIKALTNGIDPSLEAQHITIEN